MSIKSFRLILLSFLVFTLTACGGGGGGDAAADPATVPLSQTLIEAAQASLDVVEDVLTGGATVFSIAEIDAIQALFDVFTDLLVGGADVLSAANIDTIQAGFDSFVSNITGSGAGGVLTTVQIQAAQDALDAAAP